MKSVYYIITIVITLSVIGMFFLLSHRLKAQQQSIEGLHDQIDVYKMEKSNVDLERKLNTSAISFGNLPVQKDVAMIEDSETTSLFRFAENITSPKLVLRFSYISCDVCVDTILNILKETEGFIKKEDIVLLLTYDNIENLNRFEHVNHITYKTYSIQQYDSLGQFESYNIPYLFVLLPKRKTLNELFFPLKENPLRTREYLYAMGNKYLKPGEHEKY
jgi:copper chaperone CopZ